MKNYDHLKGCKCKTARIIDVKKIFGTWIVTLELTKPDGSVIRRIKGSIAKMASKFEFPTLPSTDYYSLKVDPDQLYQTMECAFKLVNETPLGQVNELPLFMERVSSRYHGGLYQVRIEAKYMNPQSGKPKLINYNMAKWNRLP